MCSPAARRIVRPRCAANESSSVRATRAASWRARSPKPAPRPLHHWSESADRRVLADRGGSLAGALGAPEPARHGQPSAAGPEWGGSQSWAVRSRCPRRDRSRRVPRRSLTRDRMLKHEAGGSRPPLRIRGIGHNTGPLLGGSEPSEELFMRKTQSVRIRTPSRGPSARCIRAPRRGVPEASRRRGGSRSPREDPRRSRRGRGDAE